jgi:hypothetical protein
MEIQTMDAPQAAPDDLALRSLELGTKYPYDERAAVDAAHAAAQGVIADLCDRRGIKWGFSDIELDVRQSIVDALAAIIRLSFKVTPPDRPLRRVTVTRTLATMEVSPRTYDEIADKLRAALYQHAFDDGLIDMSGIGLERAPDDVRAD